MDSYNHAVEYKHNDSGVDTVMDSYNHAVEYKHNDSGVDTVMDTYNRAVEYKHYWQTALALPSGYVLAAFPRVWQFRAATCDMRRKWRRSGGRTPRMFEISTLASVLVYVFQTFDVHARHFADTASVPDASALVQCVVDTYNRAVEYNLGGGKGGRGWGYCTDLSEAIYRFLL